MFLRIHFLFLSGKSVKLHPAPQSHGVMKTFHWLFVFYVILVIGLATLYVDGVKALRQVH